MVQGSGPGLLILPAVTCRLDQGVFHRRSIVVVVIAVCRIQNDFRVDLGPGDRVQMGGTVRIAIDMLIEIVDVTIAIGLCIILGVGDLGRFRDQFRRGYLVSGFIHIMDGDAVLIDLVQIIQTEPLIDAAVIVGAESVRDDSIVEIVDGVAITGETDLIVAIGGDGDGLPFPGDPHVSIADVQILAVLICDEVVIVPIMGKGPLAYSHIRQGTDFIIVAEGHADLTQSRIIGAGKIGPLHRRKVIGVDDGEGPSVQICGRSRAYDAVNREAFSVEFDRTATVT